jgi:biopolymer transport protein ExbD
MEVPKPAESVARDRRLPENVVINVLYRGPDAPATYQFGAIPVDTLEALSARLAAARRLAPHMEVVLRADRRLPYEDVRAVMQLLGEHEISHFQLVAEVESLP